MVLQVSPTIVLPVVPPIPNSLMRKAALGSLAVVNSWQQTDVELTEQLVGVGVAVVVREGLAAEASVERHRVANKVVSESFIIVIWAT